MLVARIERRGMIVRRIHRWSVVFCAATLLVAAVNVVSPVHVQAVTTISQVGADIDGEASNNASGSAVAISLDGNIVAIGAPVNSDNGNSSGQVRVYQYSSNAWTKIGADIDGESSNDNSGEAVAISSDGTVVAIGAPQNSNGNGNGSGQVRVYLNTGF